MSNINFTYTNLTPFKWYVFENFPFIEADFDALTNWKLFCKLGKEINKIINSVNLSGQQVEELTKAFNELQNYVNNYFNNLDVQEEINNKLDQMVTDGDFDTILSNILLKLKIGNVLNYRAVGDGVTDDTNAFKNAIQANDIIYVPEGSYKITDTLIIQEKSLFGTEKSEIVLSNNINLFEIGFHTKVNNLLIKNTVENYNKSVFEISSRTIGQDVSKGNFLDVEISNIKSLYYDGQPVNSNGSFFTIYASKTNGGTEDNKIYGFWGINIHDITSFEYYKYFIKLYSTFTEDNAWITGCNFTNIISMRNDYFWFGKKDDSSLDATGYKDGEHIVFDKIQIQSDFMMKYAYCFTCGDKIIDNSIVWDWQNSFDSTNNKPFTFLQQVTNLTNIPIIINEEYGKIEDRCDIKNGGNSLNSLLYVFKYTSNTKRNPIENTNNLVLNSVNENKYYFLGRMNIVDFFEFTLVINRDNNAFKGGNSLYALNFSGAYDYDQEKYNVKVNLAFGGISYQDLPTFYYKIVTIDTYKYVEFYMSKLGGNSNLTVLGSLNLLPDDFTRFLLLEPKELSEIPQGLTTITISDLSMKIPVSETNTLTSDGANLGVMMVDMSKRKFVGCNYFGFQSFAQIASGTSRPSEYLEAGQMYFDTSLNKPVFWNGTNWVDATGSTV